MSESERHYILMSDIINSSSKESGLLMKVFKKVVTDTNQKFSAQILSPLTITLGDEFQGVVKSLKAAIAIIFYFDEQLLSYSPAFSVRHVLNYGAIGTPINSKQAHGMLGEGLSKARELLGEIKETHFEISIAGLNSELVNQLKLAFELYRSIYNSWSEEDKKVAFLFLKYKDYRLVAKEYQRDPSTMWRREKSLKIREFNAAKELIQLLTANG